MSWRNAARWLVVLVVVLSFGFSALAAPVPPIEILTTTEAYDPIRYEAGFMVAEAWRKLGFEVSVRPMEFSALIERFYDHQDFDVVISGWSGRVDRLDPQHYLGTMHGGQTTLGANNPGGYVNPEYDRLFDLQQAEFDVEKRREYVLQMQEIAARDVPVDVLYYRDEVIAYNNTTFDGLVVMAGEGLYNEWSPLEAIPLTDKKVLTIGTPQEPDTINPMDSSTVWGWKFMRMMYDKLVRLSPAIEPIPWAASEIISVDDVTVDVVIRPGMTFHDGHPVTAEDVKFSYDYNIEKDFAYFRPFYSVIDSTELIGDDTVRFHLKEPFAPLITVTFSQIPILPKHIWENIDNPADLTPAQIPTVGSGPFKFDRYDRGEYKRLSKFDEHFAADGIAIDAIEWIIYADAEGVFTGLITGEIDMTAWRMEPGQIPLAERESHLTVVSVPDFGYYHLTPNLRRNVLGDVAVRRALTAAVDKQTLVNVLLDGRGEPGTSVIAPINGFWHNPDVEQHPYDLERARQILADAGYTWDSEGRIHAPDN